MIQNLRGEIEKVASFLNRSLTEAQINKLTEHLSFNNFKNNELVNNEGGKRAGRV